MTRENNGEEKRYSMKNHQRDSLFTEWPAPSDTVAGFGGSPDRAADRQWQMKHGK